MPGFDIAAPTLQYDDSREWAIPRRHEEFAGETDRVTRKLNCFLLELILLSEALKDSEQTYE